MRLEGINRTITSPVTNLHRIMKYKKMLIYIESCVIINIMKRADG